MTSGVANGTLDIPADQSKGFITERNDTRREGRTKQISMLLPAATLVQCGPRPAAGQTTCHGREQHLSWSRHHPTALGVLVPQRFQPVATCTTKLSYYTPILSSLCVCVKAHVCLSLCACVYVWGCLCARRSEVDATCLSPSFPTVCIGPIIFQSILELYRVSLDGHLAQRSPILRVGVFSPQLTDLRQPSQRCPDIFLLGDSRC